MSSLKLALSLLAVMVAFAVVCCLLMPDASAQMLAPCSESGYVLCHPADHTCGTGHLGAALRLRVHLGGELYWTDWQGWFVVPGTCIPIGSQLCLLIEDERAQYRCEWTDGTSPTDYHTIPVRIDLGECK